jgi:hypothetical protein
MSEPISESEIQELVGAAEIVRLEGMDTGSQHYWQAYIPEPVNSTIQVIAETEEEARENLMTATSEMMQARQESVEAAETPVEELEGYNPPESD